MNRRNSWQAPEEISVEILMNFSKQSGELLGIVVELLKKKAYNQLPNVSQKELLEESQK